MIEDEEIDAFLEHHGIKGQKWGQRKDRTANNARFGSKGRTTKQKLALAGGLAIGAATVALMLSRSGTLRTSSLPKPSSRDIFKSTADVARVRGAIPMPSGKKLAIDGATKLKDIPKNTKVSQFSPDMQKRLRQVYSELGKQGTPQSRGINMLFS